MVCPQGLREIDLCADVIALPEAHHAHHAVRDHRFRHPPLVFGVAQETFRGFPRQTSSPRIVLPDASPQ
jgi:hypothetical protein